MTRSGRTHHPRRCYPASYNQPRNAHYCRFIRRFNFQTISAPLYRETALPVSSAFRSRVCSFSIRSFDQTVTASLHIPTSSSSNRGVANQAHLQARHGFFHALRIAKTMSKAALLPSSTMGCFTVLRCDNRKPISRRTADGSPAMHGRPDSLLSTARHRATARFQQLPWKITCNGECVSFHWLSVKLRRALYHPASTELHPACGKIFGSYISEFKTR